jgi:hypothetical protein
VSTSCRRKNSSPGNARSRAMVLPVCAPPAPSSIAGLGIARPHLRESLFVPLKGRTESRFVPRRPDPFRFSPPSGKESNPAGFAYGRTNVSPLNDGHYSEIVREFCKPGASAPLSWREGSCNDWRLDTTAEPITLRPEHNEGVLIRTKQPCFYSRLCYFIVTETGTPARTSASQKRSACGLALPG